MIKKIMITILFLTSSWAISGNNLLEEFDKKIEPHFQILKGNKRLLQPIADKEINNEKLTKKNLELNIFLGCHSLIHLNKIAKISNEKRYINLEKAQRISKMIPKIKNTVFITAAECKKEGLYIPN